MESQQSWLDVWLRENRALVFYDRPHVMLWCHNACITAPTVEEAVREMMERMGMVEGAIERAHQPLLLTQSEERN